MNSADNGDEDDLDIYSNLPTFHYDDSLHKLETINKSLVKTISELEKKVASLSVELTSCKKEKQQLEKNISSLYKSAKQEITRKDKRISELTLKEVNLRACSRRFPVKQEISTSHNSQFVLEDDRQNDFKSASNDRNERKSPVQNYYRTRSRAKKEYDSQVPPAKSSKTNDSSSKSKRRDRGKSLDENSSHSGSGKSKTKKPLAPKSVIKPKVEPGFDAGDAASTTNRNGGLENFAEVDMKPDLDSCTLPPNIGEISVIENVQKSPTLPEFQGPRTTFSLRRYKKLFGVSPFKQAPAHSFIGQGSLKDSRNQSSHDSRNTPCSTTSPESKITGSSIVEAESLPRRLCDSSRAKKLDSNVSNCDSIDSEKSRLIDNLELQRKRPIVESDKKNHSHSDTNKILGKKVTSVHTVHTTKALVHVPARLEVDKDERNGADRMNSEEQSSDVRSFSDSKSHCNNDVSILDKNRVENNISQILFGDNLVNKNVALNFISSELEDEAAKCNKIPLTADTKDILANEEDIAEDYENAVQNDKVCEENSKVSSVPQDESLVKEKNGILNEPSGSECKDSDEIHCKNIETHVNNDLVKNNGISEVYKNEDTKVELLNIKQASKNNLKAGDEHPSDQDSCDSYVLEMTHSPPVPEQVNNVNERNSSSETGERKTDPLQETVVLNGSCIATEKENSPEKVSQIVNSSMYKDSNSSLNYLSEIKTPLGNVNCKSTDQQLRDLFGDSPSKSCDNFSPETEVVTASDFCLFSNTVSGSRSNETNKPSDLLNPPPVSNSERACSDEAVCKVQKDESIFISPDVSKSYSNFQEAFQQSKQDTKKLDCKINCTTAADVKTNPSVWPCDINNDNLIDKENPSDLAVQKSSSSASQSIKHILCDKKQNDFNINNTDERQCDIKIQRLNDESDKCDLTDRKMSDVFSREIITNKSCTEPKQSNPNMNSLKITENSLLTSGDDTNLCAIKKFTNIDDTISPIKTPCKNFSLIGVLTKADADVTRFSENSSFNDNSTFNMIKRYSRANELVTPIKTPYKQLQPVTEFVCEEKRKESLAASPTVIKKDGITICLTSEHCDFKRERRMKKIIRFNTNVKNNEKKKPCETPSKANRNAKIASSSVSDKNTRSTTGGRLSDDDEVFVRKSRRIVLNKSPIDSKKLCVPDNTRDEAPKTKKLNENVKNVNSPINISDVNAAENHSSRKTIDSTRLKIGKCNGHDISKNNKSRKKHETIEKKPIVLTNKYRYDMKRTLSANFERRSPSEYFNQQQKTRLKTDRHFHQRAGIRRPLRLKSPTPVAYRKRRSVEKKLIAEGRTELGKLKTVSKKPDRFNVSVKGSNGKDVSVENSSLDDKKNICLPIRRLSESPKIQKEIPSVSTSLTSSGAGVRNFMEWKIFPLEIKNSSFNLAQKFISDKKIPDFITKPKINKSVEVKSSALISLVNNKTTPVQNQTSVSRPMIICRRIKRTGERKLEDSAVSTSSVPPSFATGFTKNVGNSAVKTDEDNRGGSSTKELELGKRKHAAQKTHRCIVKTPLDFKNKFSDVSANDELESSALSSDESQFSDESWSPKKSNKKRKLR